VAIHAVPSGSGVVVSSWRGMVVSMGVSLDVLEGDADVTGTASED
jgi:hypothetical protein